MKNTGCLFANGTTANFHDIILRPRAWERMILELLLALNQKNLFGYFDSVLARARYFYPFLFSWYKLQH